MPCSWHNLFQKAVPTEVLFERIESVHETIASLKDAHQERKERQPRRVTETDAQHTLVAALADLQRDDLARHGVGFTRSDFLSFVVENRIETSFFGLRLCRGYRLALWPFLAHMQTHRGDSGAIGMLSPEASSISTRPS